MPHPPGSWVDESRLKSAKSHGQGSRTMMEIIGSLLLKNRTIVSTDFRECLGLLAEEIPLMIHRYPSGTEYGTWVIPPQWDVKKALLSDGEQVIASVQDHPLFLAPYSSSFTGWISREELLRHTRSKPETPEAFSYEFRFAYDFRKRLSDWAITLPHRIVEDLQRPRYFVDIQVETSPGEMLVGESRIRGETDTTFAFLTHLCHSGQANDGLAGVAAGVELMRRVKKEFPRPRLSYQLLVMPETIGSAVYLASEEERINSYVGAVFLEMVGIRSPLRLAHTRRGDTYIDRVMKEALCRLGAPFAECPFLESWGNDERIFDSPGVGIPAGSLERFPFHWFHTSQDNLEQTDPSSLEEIVEILVEIVRILESDFIPHPRQKVPVYLTRYALYADWERERAQHDVNASIIDLLWSGLSVFDMAKRLDLPYEKVRQFVISFVEHRLLETSGVTPAYGRRSLERQP